MNGWRSIKNVPFDGEIKNKEQPNSVKSVSEAFMNQIIHDEPTSSPGSSDDETSDGSEPLVVQLLKTVGRRNQKKNVEQKPRQQANKRVVPGTMVRRPTSSYENETSKRQIGAPSKPPSKRQTGRPSKPLTRRGNKAPPPRMPTRRRTRASVLNEGKSSVFSCEPAGNVMVESDEIIEVQQPSTVGPQRLRKQSKPKKRKNNIRKEIKLNQLTTRLLIPRLPFQRLVREVLHQFKNDFRVRTATLECLQEASEAYLIQLFEDSYLCSLHRKRVTLTDADIRLTQILRGPLEVPNYQQ